MEEQNLKYISNIEIKGLWGRYDVNWRLNSDVNILVGENGTGKSTILKILDYYLLICELNGLNFKTDLLSEEHTIHNKYKKLNISFDSEENNISVNVNLNTQTIYSVKSSNFKIQNFTFISTFDTPILRSDLDKKYNPELKTEIDYQLKYLIELYLNYQLDLTKKIINKKQDSKLVFAKRRYFIETINRLFEKTLKVIDEEENGISLLLSDITSIKPYDLSSGEKQLLIILLNVLCQDEKPWILMMDEPEISLDIAWQFELLSIIRTLNPHCQLIVVTHSPAIYGKGWRDKVTFIEDIIPQLKKATV